MTLISFAKREPEVFYSDLKPKRYLRTKRQINICLLFLSSGSDHGELLLKVYHNALKRNFRVLRLKKERRPAVSLRKQPSFFALGPSGVSQSTVTRLTGKRE